MSEQYGEERSTPSRVFDLDGVSGVIQGPAGDREHAVVRLDSGAEILVPTREMRQRADGAYGLGFSFAQLGTASAPVAPHTGLANAMPFEGGQDLRIPVIEERVTVDKQLVETGGVRVTKHVREHEQVVEETVLHDEVQVKRVAVNRFIEEPVGARTEGDTTIIPVLEEVLVVQRRLLLKEEIHVTKRQVASRTAERVTLLSEDVEVDRVPPRDGGGA